MIITLDNVKCKKGDRVWEIGISETGNTPTMSVVHGGTNRLANPERCWKDYDLCLAACNELNKRLAA